jgi:hypothetical protein
VEGNVPEISCVGHEVMEDFFLFLVLWTGEGVLLLSLLFSLHVDMKGIK